MVNNPTREQVDQDNIIGAIYHHPYKYQSLVNDAIAT